MPLQCPIAPTPQPLASQPASSFWQHRWAQNILPLITSLAVHTAIVIVSVALATVVVTQVMPIDEEQTIIPESAFADVPQAGGVPNLGISSDPFRQAMQDKDPAAGTPEGWASKVGPLDVAVLNAGGGVSDDVSNISGTIGVGGYALGQGFGIGAGKGNLTGGGDGRGDGPLAMFGTPGGGVEGPKNIFGVCGCVAGSSRKIVFVCDASASMLNKMPALNNELSKAVESMRRIQSFNLIFFQDDGVLTLSKEGLLLADLEAKRAAVKFLDDMTTRGTSDPIPALRLAFKQQPHLIYLLTDGDFPDNTAVRAEISRLNADKKVKVNTIAFVNDKDTDTAFIELLTTIANENGGYHKHVAETELKD